MNREFLRRLLVEEAFAYGFTIAFWGSGVLLIDAFGVFGIGGVLAYATGAITGFGLLLVGTFEGVLESIDVDGDPSYHVLAGIHYVAALVPIVTAHLLVRMDLGETLTLFLVGIAVPVWYNLFVTAEEVLSEGLRRIERKAERRR
ncbi:hypothetical protein [Halopenitus persicus]|uniref:Uncharacterized protein n=1 Tax=Halopenitus persicus TaxID=1048396 RepID=A0A1H3EFW8_9EURY|nr:hypothetical protein [Halopenitus persicus]QHS17548.1 hypothetical protein GWK26_10545 [haloarchaeon 3A1-DGR]SDX77520.1 hypothetical protein SAMN05216564_101425 [Halopenitus persicus]